jgi:hypothetical protein
MKNLSLLALGLAVCVPASAQSGPAGRIGALLEGSPQLNGAVIPPLASIPVPAETPATQAPAPVESIVPADLWATLAPPDAATLAFLSSRIPGLNAAAVRVLPFEAVDAVIAVAADRAMSPLDLFTDPAFRGDAIFYLSPETIKALFERYEVHMLTPAYGLAKDGKSYAMQALVAGGGRIDALYDRDQFNLDNPLMPGHSYKLANRVTEIIQGPGDVTIEGAWIHMGLITPKILRTTKLSPTEGRVETNYGTRNRPVTAIRRR